MKRLVPVLVVLALILSVPLTVFAQEGGNPLCNGLSDDDCEKMLAALATVNTVGSFTIPAWEANFTMNDGTEDVGLSASGRGGVVLGKTVDDIVLHIVIDSLSVTPAEGEIPEYVEVIMAGGFGYVNYNGEWYGEELSEEDVADLESTLGSLNMGDAESLDPSALGIDLSGAITTTRGEDEDMHDQSVAMYSMAFDLGALLTSLLSSPMVGEAMGMAGEEAMSPEELQMMAMIFVPILGQTSISAGLGVGNDDGYIHKAELNVVLDIDMSMFDPEAGKIAGELAFSAEVSNVDEGYSVEAPTEYGTMEEFEEKYGDALNLESATGGLF